MTHNDPSRTVRQDLLAANGLDAEELARSLALIGACHVDYADIYCQRTAFESWHLEEGMVKSGSFQIDQGAGVRAVSGEKTAFAYTDSLDADGIRRRVLLVNGGGCVSFRVLILCAAGSKQRGGGQQNVFPYLHGFLHCGWQAV